MFFPKLFQTLDTYRIAKNRNAPSQGFATQNVADNLIHRAADPTSDDFMKEPEVFADLGMTDVIASLRATYSVNPEDPTTIPAFKNGDNARDIRCAWEQYLRQILLGRTTNLEFHSDECE